MKQYEAVIEIMEKNGGFSTLGYLYQNVLKVPGVKWNTKTPLASIRRIVQDSRFFFKIRPGLWALNSRKDLLPDDLVIAVRDSSHKKSQEFDHSYFQGLLVEIGNIKKYLTFVPNQDQNKDFLGKRLKDIITQNQYFTFAYDYVVKRAQMVDVSWFNERKMPHAFFEIEVSTDFNNSLIKFCEFQDFRVRYFIIADKVRKREFDTKISLNAYSPIKNEVKFLNFEQVSQWHTKSYEIEKLEKDILSRMEDE